jgi:hypothetical protein
MPTLTLAHTIDRAVEILQDPGNTRWAESELIGWFNDGQREIVAIVPSAYSQTVSHPLAAGTRQTIPAAGYQLIRVVRNMGTTGTTPGRVVRAVPETQLDAITPDWHASAPAATTLHYTYDERTPRTFHVYPPAIAGNTVELVYSVAPQPHTAKTDVQALDDVYANTLLDYVLYRAFNKDGEAPANAQRAVAHYQAFANAISNKATADKAYAPRVG